MYFKIICRAWHDVGTFYKHLLEVKSTAPAEFPVTEAIAEGTGVNARAR